MSDGWKPVQVRRGLHERIREAMRHQKDITSISMYVDLAIRRQLVEDRAPGDRIRNGAVAGEAGQETGSG